MRKVILAGLLAISAVSAAPVMAADAAATSAPYNTTDSTIGDLLDNPEAKAVVDKHMPGFSSNPQVEMARGMTFRAIQPMAPDQIKTETLDLIDADLAKVPAKKG